MKREEKTHFGGNLNKFVFCYSRVVVLHQVQVSILPSDPW